MDFVSALAYAGWPAIPTARGAQLLTIQFQREYSQWLSPAEIGMAQGKQLARVVEQAGAKVPFYRDRLAELKWDPEQPIEPSDWQDVPVLSRSELQTGGDSLLAPACEAERAKHTYATSSGSTGSPVRTLGTTLTRLMWHALTLRQHLWHRRDLNQKFATIAGTTGRVGILGTHQLGVSIPD